MHARSALASIACCMLAVPAGAADGLAVPDGQVVWPQWQARVTVDAPLLLDRGRLVGLRFLKAQARRLDQGAARRIDLRFVARVED